MNFKGKNILITGASSGIGKAFAYLLAKQQANLILVARREEKLNEIASDLSTQFGIDVHVLAQDLSKVGSANALYQQVKGQNLDVDVLINNAGFGKWEKFEKLSAEIYQDMIHLNVTSLTELCHLFIKDFLQKGEAGIINVGSTASFVPVPFSSVYAATKAYVLNFTEGLVGEYSNTNINIHCLCPGGTATEFNQVANDKVDVSNVDMKTPAEVAKEGLDAFVQGKHYVLTGRKLQMMLLKFLPRRRVIDMIAKSWRDRVETS